MFRGHLLPMLIVAEALDLEEMIVSHRQNDCRETLYQQTLKISTLAIRGEIVVLRRGGYTKAEGTQVA